MSGILFQGVNGAINIASNAVQGYYNSQDGNQVGVGINAAQIGAIVASPILGKASSAVGYTLNKAGAANDTVRNYRDGGGMEPSAFMKTWAPVAVSLVTVPMRATPLGITLTLAQTGYTVYTAYEAYQSHQPTGK